MSTDNSVLESKKLNSLPPDLKKIAQEIINEKEGVKIPSLQDMFVPPAQPVQSPPPQQALMTNEPLFWNEIEDLKRRIQTSKQTRYYNNNIMYGEQSYTEQFVKLWFRDSTGQVTEFTVVSHTNPPLDWWADKFVDLLKQTGKKWYLV